MKTTKIVKAEELIWWWATGHYDIHLCGVAKYRGDMVRVISVNEWDGMDSLATYEIETIGFMWLWRIHRFLFNAMVKNRNFKNPSVDAYYKIISKLFFTHNT